MPYFVYHITQGPTALIKHLELQQEFEHYRDAREFARSARGKLNSDQSPPQVKVIFAANSLEAEERLLEHREKPILREWEK
jgi:hypothetical protein